MRIHLKMTRAFFLALIGIIGFVVIAILIGDQQIKSFDSAIISAVQGQENPTLTAVMKFFTFIGSVPMSCVLTLVVLIVLYVLYRRRAELIFFFVVMAGMAIFNQVLKMAFHRQRPDLHRLIQETGYSFPSGHSMTAFALYGALAFLLWRHLPTAFWRGLVIVVAVLMTLLIGISRIYLGVHYPSDVLGGYLASGFWLSIAIWYFQQYMEQRYEKKHKS